ncbi:MAG: radical SAM/SPASM domain-containing protein [Acutalibacteraceae bacterium]
MIRTAEPVMSGFLHLRALEKGVPISGTFELTANCNFSCPMCYVHGIGKRHEDLSTKEWLSLAAQVKKSGTLFLLLTGGEPLLRKDFEEIYVSLSKMGFMLSINSNGSLIEDYMPVFKKYPPSRINISLYASDRETYKSFCKADQFERVVGAIEMLKNEQISVRLNSVFTAENYKKAGDIIRFAQEHDLKLKPTAYNYPRLRISGRPGKNEARLTPEQAAQCAVESDLLRFDTQTFIRRAEKLLEKADESTDTQAFTKIRCRAGRCSYWITWDGKMRPCGMMTEPETMPLEVGFDKAWEDLKQKVKGIILSPECSVCEKRVSCPVCAAMCLAETGSFNKKPEYVCSMFQHTCDLTEKQLLKIGRLPNITDSYGEVSEEDFCDY